MRATCEHAFVGSEIASLGADFQRAVQQGNVMRAEAAARQLGQLPLDEALRLLFLYAEKEPIKYERAALRWLSRYVTEGKAVSLLKGAARARGAVGASLRGAGGCGKAACRSGAALSRRVVFPAKCDDALGLRVCGCWCCTRVDYVCCYPGGVFFDPVDDAGLAF
jgi:hypothetical protein